MIHSVYINKISAFLPHDPVNNEEMESRLGQVGAHASRARKVILRSNGIKTRHYAIDPETNQPSYTNAALAAEAVRGLCDESFQLQNIDCLVASSSQPDQVMPNHAVMVHGELGNPPCEVVATSGVCVCGITALKYAWMNVALGEKENAVAAASEVASNLMRAENFNAEYESNIEQLAKRPEIAFEKDFLRWMLSDGAGAVLLQNKPNATQLSLRIDWIEILSFADQMPACMYAGGDFVEDEFVGWSRFSPAERDQLSVLAVKQNVKLLNEHVIHYTVVETLKRVLAKHPMKTSEIDYFVPHYSSEFFRERVAAGLDEVGFTIGQERWFTNLTSKGNTGSASIYIMLDELFKSGRLQKGQRLLCYIPESGRFSSAFMHLTVV